MYKIIYSIPVLSEVKEATFKSLNALHDFLDIIQANKNFKVCEVIA